MAKEFLVQIQELALAEDTERRNPKKRRNSMGHSILPLDAKCSREVAYSSFLQKDTNACCKKRQCDWDLFKIENQTDQTSIELQLNDPLPNEWEQCLDLSSGIMYYINRETLEKRWSKPKHRNPDLDLNISFTEDSQGKRYEINDDQMVAVVCSKCHLLVMLCMSSLTCPNCKFMNFFSSFNASSSSLIEEGKSMKTLNLLTS